MQNYPAPESPRLLSGDGGCKAINAFDAGFRTVSIRSPQLLLGELHFFLKTYIALYAQRFSIFFVNLSDKYPDNIYASFLM